LVEEERRDKRNVGRREYAIVVRIIAATGCALATRQQHELTS